MKFSGKQKNITRRFFLKISGILAGSWIVGPVFGSFARKAHANTRPRVISVHEPSATYWDHASGFHWDFINQNVVNKMVAAGVKALALKSDLGKAWQTIIPYKSGQSVAIKINLNNNWSCDSDWESDGNGRMNAYPETVNAVIDGLLQIGVPAQKIWIVEPSRVILNRFIDKIANQNVRFYSSDSGCSPNSFVTDYVDENSVYASKTTHPPGDVVRPAQVFVEADHIINIPLLKGHGGAGITLSMKNHYGSVTFRGSNQNAAREKMHKYAYENTNPDPNKSVIADINNNPVIRDKTRLIIGDGLFGNPISNIDSPEKWNLFDNKDPNMLFFGTDPIATDSVMCDYINAERKLRGRPEATRSALVYGQTLGLGVHDRWDSYLTKNYTRIDYFELEGTNYNPGTGTDLTGVSLLLLQICF